MSGLAVTKVMLMLDAVIDTRLGTLNILDAEAVVGMNPPDYLLRTRDEFPFIGIDTDLFNVAYKNRDIYTLHSSMMTGILPIVQNAIHQYTTMINPTRNGPLELDLNLYPYNIDSESARVMADLVEFKMGGIVKVNPVCIPYSSMTLAYLANNYHTVVIYDWVDWACANEQSFRSESAPAVTMVAPDILRGEKLPENPTDEIRAAFKVAHPTAYMEFALADYIGLSFESVSFFSMAH